MFGASMGLATLGWFEINPNDVRHKVMHYIGFVLCLGSVVGLGFETLFQAWYFWILFVGSIFGLIGFAMFVIKASKTLPSEDSKYVNRISKQCIFCESTVLFFGAVSLDVYLSLLTSYDD